MIIKIVYIFESQILPRRRLKSSFRVHIRRDVSYETSTVVASLRGLFQLGSVALVLFRMEWMYEQTRGDDLRFNVLIFSRTFGSQKIGGGKLAGCTVDGTTMKKKKTKTTAAHFIYEHEGRRNETIIYHFKH